MAAERPRRSLALGSLRRIFRATFWRTRPRNCGCILYPVPSCGWTDPGDTATFQGAHRSARRASSDDRNRRGGSRGPGTTRTGRLATAVRAEPSPSGIEREMGIWPILQPTVMITGFVAVMMILVEYLNEQGNVAEGPRWIPLAAIRCCRPPRSDARVSRRVRHQRPLHPSDGVLGRGRRVHDRNQRR